MKKLSFLILTLLFAGCSGSIDTANLSPEERLKSAQVLYDDEDYQEAINEFQNIVLQFPGNAVVDDAQYYLGLTRFQREEYIMAGFEFSKLIKNMPASSLVPDAQYMLAQSYYELSPVYSLDQTYSRKAIDEFQAFIDFFPLNPRVPEAEQKIVELNTKLAQKEYSNAVIYEKMEYYTASLLYYNNVVEIYHDTPFASMALYNRIKVLIKRNKIAEANTDIDKFLQRYPDNQKAEEIQSLKTKMQSNLSASQ